MMTEKDFIGMTYDEALNKMNDVRYCVIFEMDDFQSIIDMWNNAISEGNLGGEYYIEYLDDVNLNSHYSTAAAFAEAVSYSQNFKWQDDFFYVDDCNEPISFTYLNDDNCPINFELLAEYLSNYKED